MDPQTTLGPEAHWRQALEQGRILLQRDPVDGKCYFPPRLAGPQGQPLEWVETSGRGTVYSLTVVSQRPPQPPYNVALVDLEEGVRMMSRVDAVAPDGAAIGAAVIAAIAHEPDGPMVVFHPA